MPWKGASPNKLKKYGNLHYSARMQYTAVGFRMLLLAVGQSSLAWLAVQSTALPTSLVLTAPFASKINFTTHRTTASTGQ